MFEIINVSKQFGAEYALRNISMTLGNGMNFIIGASGSGKTTLLRILSGMESDFEGEAFYGGQSLKSLNGKEKSRIWGGEFGFVWQDFNLLDDRTVLENILLPQYLQQEQSRDTALKILRELKISKLENQKAGKLSGGQKQRVAIARELMKNPRVIFADEPTSALDAQSAQNIMDILRTLSKKRTVVVVTHDTSLIGVSDKVYELDKGELAACPKQIGSGHKKVALKKGGSLSLGGALTLGLTSLKRRFGQGLAMVLALLAASTLLLISLSGAVTGGGQKAFDELFDTYGDSLLDISIAQSFMSAGGTDGKDSDEPNANVDQNVDGLFEKYKEDSRVTHVLFAQPFNDIKVTADGKSYSISSSGNVPVMNRLLEGSLPMGAENEVVVPESFVKQMGLTNKEVIGKEIAFKGNINNWESGQNVVTPVQVKARITGVIDTNMTVEYQGQITKYPIDDSFFFSPAALKEMRERAGMKAEPGNFYIQAKTPEDLISLKDELNAAGIVPLGRFELVEDMVRLNQQTAQQSGSAVIVIAMLSMVVVLAVALLNAVLRRREYAIYKVSGFSGRQLIGTAAAEFALLAAGTSVLFLATSPLLQFAATSLWNVSILNARLLLTGVGLIVCVSVLGWGLTAAVAVMTKAANALRTGDR